MEIYFIRHAESVSNINPLTVGGRNNSIPLTELGVLQAKALGKRLKNLSFDKVFCSPAVRAQLTCHYSLNLNPVLDLRLVELCAGDWEGVSKKEIYAKPWVNRALDDDNWNFVPGDIIKGESQSQGALRVLSWLNEVVKNDFDKILVFTHGLAIKYLFTELFGWDKSTAFQIPLDNTSINTIKYENGKFVFVSKNDFSHLTENNIDKNYFDME